MAHSPLPRPHPDTGYVVLSCFSYVWLFVTLCTRAHQARLSLGFSRQEYWSGLPCPSPGSLPESGIEPVPLMSPALAGRFFTTSATWEASQTLGGPQVAMALVSPEFPPKLGTSGMMLASLCSQTQSPKDCKSKIMALPGRLRTNHQGKEDPSQTLELNGTVHAGLLAKWGLLSLFSFWLLLFWNEDVYSMPIPSLYLLSRSLVWFPRFTAGKGFASGWIINTISFIPDLLLLFSR